MNENSNKFYVYELVNSLTGDVIYVGKGCGDRMYTHVRQSKMGKHINTDLQNTILNIIERGGKIEYRTPHINISEQSAYEFEIKMINEYGLKNLCNKINYKISYYSTQTMKGKTYEELYGPERAAELKMVRSLALRKNNPSKLEHVKKQISVRNTENNPSKREDVRKKLSEKSKGRSPWNKGIFGLKRKKNEK
jgi:hypothetical protein